MSDACGAIELIESVLGEQGLQFERVGADAIAVALPGEQPLRLRPSDQQGIEAGTVVTIADSVSFTYEVNA